MESMAEADPERLPPPFPPPPPPPPLSDLILSLEQATLMAKQLPSTADPTHLLHIHSSLHQAHLHLSNFLSTHKFPQPQRQNSLSSATGNEPMQVGDGDGDGDDDCDGFGEGDSRPTIDIVEEQMRDCFIKNKRPKRRLSASAAALAEERRTNGDGFVGSVKVLTLMAQRRGLWSLCTSFMAELGGNRAKTGETRSSVAFCTAMNPIIHKDMNTNDIVYTWERIQIITHVLLENDYSNPRYSALDTNKVETTVIMPLASWQEQVYLDLLPLNF